MNTKQLENLLYAQGWLEGQIESMLADAKRGTLWVPGTPGENPVVVDEKEVEIAQQCWNMWEQVSGGLDALRRENAELQNRIQLARNALN